jgi:phage shock protein C
MRSFTSSQLHRSSTDRIVAGVCGGLAESLDLDPSLVRLAFVIGTLWGGLGLLLYVILALVLPVSNEPILTTPVRHGRSLSESLVGGVLVVLGALILVGNLGLAPWLTWHMFWPGVLILVGIALLLRRTDSEEGANA